MTWFGRVGGVVMVVMKRWWGWLEVNSEREDAVWYFYVCKAVNAVSLEFLLAAACTRPVIQRGRAPTSELASEEGRFGIQ